jgi:hypothetical protein
MRVVRLAFSSAQSPHRSASKRHTPHVTASVVRQGKYKAFFVTAGV